MTFFGGFLLTGAPSSSHYIGVIPAVCWLTAVPLGWLAGKGYWRLAVTGVFLIVATDLLFYFCIYVPSGPTDLIHAFPAGPWP
jgi:hypothetical protein